MLCLRIMQYSLHVFDHLLAAGENYDMKLAGAYAVDTLRLEKGIPYWGQDLDTKTTPLEAGLDYSLDMRKVLRCIRICFASSHNTDLSNWLINTKV